jgi:hypothetical protein
VGVVQPEAPQPTTPPPVVEVLSDGSQRVEITTTVQEADEYDIQIQGSDRKYPAIVLRRKHRGVGATIKTISRNGQHSDLYADYTEAVDGYKARRQQRLDNTQNHGEEPTTRGDSESGIIATPESWLTQTVQSVVNGRDNSKGNPDRS